MANDDKNIEEEKEGKNESEEVDEEGEDDDADLEWCEDIDENACEASAQILNQNTIIKQSKHFGRREPEEPLDLEE